MPKDSKFDIDLKKAKNFFKKKLENQKSNSSGLKDQKFRAVDEETVKISKLSARIEFLKDKLNKRKKKETVKITNETLKKAKKVQKTRIFTKSIKNRDINGNPLLNFQSKFKEKNSNSYVIIKDFEINSKLFLAGNVNKLPNDIILELIEKGMIQKLGYSSNHSQKDNGIFYVDKTFGLSETKRSKLRNTKNFKK